MPNRILKESICTSDSLDSLNWFEEVLFYRLIVNCDDYGRFDGRPAVVKARLFPLKERLTVKDVSDALAKLAGAGIVRTYVCEGKPYLYLPTWQVHQSIRAKKSKYPAPENAEDESESIVQQSESNCMQMHADVPVIQSNTKSESESEYEDISAEPQSASTPAAILLPLNDGTDFPVSAEQCQEWAGLYPAVDVIQQLRQMRAWLDANPSRRKTRRGIKAFCVRWLGNEQDKGAKKGGRPANGVREPDADEIAAIRRMMQEG